MGIFMTILFSSLIIWRELTQIKDRFKNFFNELFKLLTLNLYLLSFIGHLCVFVDNIDSFITEFVNHLNLSFSYLNLY